MKRNTKILKIMLIIIAMLLLLNTKSYGVESGTVRMEVKKDGQVWTNINISESYQECESLNSVTSTLGTAQLQAHLTTDSDWSAMAIFSVSQYGGSTNNTPTQTSGNDSGINIGNKWTQTTGILNTANSTSNIYLSGLFDEDGKVKKYVRQWQTVREETNFVGFIDTYGWYEASQFFGKTVQYPISMKIGLFGVAIGHSSGAGSTTAGASPGVTFRPVIWN